MRLELKLIEALQSHSFEADSEVIDEQVDRASDRLRENDHQVYDISRFVVKRNGIAILDDTERMLVWL